jgi:alkylhydroperoxidase/carboxymuconolactone decarboxylase family protein YurZ
MDEGQQSLQEAGVSDDEIVDTILSVTRAAGIYTAVHTIPVDSARNILHAIQENEPVFVESGGSLKTR